MLHDDCIKMISNNGSKRTRPSIWRGQGGGLARLKYHGADFWVSVFARICNSTGHEEPFTNTETPGPGPNSCILQTPKSHFTSVHSGLV